MATALAMPRRTKRTADTVELRLGMDWPTLSYAYCRWRGEELFEQIFHEYPDMTLDQFLEWNYQPTVEPVGCFVGNALIGIGWIASAHLIDGRVVAEVGAAFFKGTRLSHWREALDSLLEYAFLDRKYAAIYGRSSATNRAARIIRKWCGMHYVDRLPWGEQVTEGTVLSGLEREEWKHDV